MSPHRTPPPFQRTLHRLQAAFWQRRVAQWLVRAAWLALLVPTIFMAGYLWLDWDIYWYYWVVPMLLIGIVSVIWSMRPIGLQKIAYRLDERMKLRAQLVTAFEVTRLLDDQAQTENMVVYRLLHKAVDIVVGFRRHVRLLNRNLWLEVNTLIGVAAVFTALVMLDALNVQVPNATAVGLPPSGQEPLADEVLQPDPRLAPPPPQQQETQATSVDELQRALRILADNLRDQSITRSAAEAIDRNELGEAAEELRRLADQLPDVSGAARNELGNNMQNAADEIGDNVPDLTDPLEAGNQALDANDLGGGSQALEDLAEVLDRIEESPQDSAQAEPESEGEFGEEEAQVNEEQQDQNGGGGESEADSPDQPPEEEELAMEGQPMELEPDPPEDDIDDSVLQPSELEAEAGDELTEDSPFAKQSIDAATELGPDPLTYPWEKREIIRRYFTPDNQPDRPRVQ
jgi:hypothetical protein